MNRKGEWGQHLPPQYGLLDSEEAHKGLRKKKRPREDHPGGHNGHDDHPDGPPPPGPPGIDRVEVLASPAKVRRVESELRQLENHPKAIQDLQTKCDLTAPGISTEVPILNYFMPIKFKATQTGFPGENLQVSSQKTPPKATQNNLAIKGVQERSQRVSQRSIQVYKADENDEARQLPIPI